MSRLQPKDVVAAQGRIDRMVRAGAGEAVKLRLSPSVVRGSWKSRHPHPTIPRSKG